MRSVPVRVTGVDGGVTTGGDGEPPPQAATVELANRIASRRTSRSIHSTPVDAAIATPWNDEAQWMTITTEAQSRTFAQQAAFSVFLCLCGY